MKSGGPWNLRGLRPETREVARDAARRSGQSVGEWLNDIIQRGDTDDGASMRFADRDEDDDDAWRDERRRPPRRQHRSESHRDDYRQPRRRPRQEREYDREYERDYQRDLAREAAIENEAARARNDAAIARNDAALAREEFGEVHARLDRLTDQLERLAYPAPRLTGAPARPQRGRLPPQAQPHYAYHPPGSRGGVSVDDAVAEIAERQRALQGGPVVAPEAPAPYYPPAPPAAPIMPAAPTMPVPPKPEPVLDIGNLEQQLRYITTRIEALRPNNELEGAVASFRKDLTEIRRQITEALPRRAVESLEIEIQGLAKRLDHSRDSGVDLGALAGLERGLGEVRDALRGLTPAENLVGFDDAVRTLAQKLDLIIGKEDPAAMQQLEAAIGALRGIVAHVASNDTLTKVAEDVRTLAAKVDSLANSAMSGQAVSLLESRLDTLANALSASTEAGQAVPRELEKLLTALIEKLERAQLTNTDHAALGNLEDRIAQLMKRLDASDAKLGNLEAVERGLADLLVHLERMRSGSGAPAKPGDGRSQQFEDSLEAVHGTVEQVVDRLAMLESGRHEISQRDPRSPAAGAPDSRPDPRPAPAKAPSEIEAPLARPPAVPAMVPAAQPQAAAADAASRRQGPPRQPIDPNLPPDHPLEPGSRGVPSAAERIAASEAAAGFAKPPVIAEPSDKPNFIAAARRAAQAAAAFAPERAPQAAAEDAPAAKATPRLRKLLVAGGAILVLFGVVHVALHMFQDAGTAVAPPIAEQASPPVVVPNADTTKQPPQSGPLVLPVPGAASDATSATAPPQPPLQIAPPPAPSESAPPPSAAAPPAGAGPATPAAPALPSRQSALDYSGDITGSLPRHAPVPVVIAPAQSGPDVGAFDKLPATIGGPTLRAAALAGDAAAEFEVATRFAEGHGVPPSNELAARWLERAAKQGLAPAQFRLGGFYEKGIGVRKDLAVARDYYKAAADKGNGKAMHNLAVLYAEGINGPADYKTAAHWFRKAADHGITDSQYNLAILYARGVGVEQNYAESYKWFALGAIAGDKEAAKKRDEVATHLDPQALAAAQAAVQKWAAEPQPEAAINVKTPPGGWDPPPAAKSKVRIIGAKAPARPLKLD